MSYLTECWLALVLHLLLVSAQGSAKEPGSRADYDYQRKPKRSGVNSITKLCLESMPDGVALAVAGTQQPVLIIFKGSHFWIVSIDELVRGIRSSNRERLLGPSNQQESSEFWPKFLDSPSYAVSFTVTRGYSFFNNVLIFKGQTLHRYRIDQLEQVGNSSWRISVSFVSSHTTEHWSYMPNVNDVQIMTLLWGTRILFVEGTTDWSQIGINPNPIYKLNDANLDNPVENIAYNAPPYPNTGNLRSTGLRFFYQLTVNDSIYFTQSGELCFTRSCKKFRRLLECTLQVEAFTGSFAFWLWHDTDLTIRLIIITLSSVMMVNFTLALSFIYNQVKRIAELT